MKGIVFNLLESFVVDNFDDETWDNIFLSTELESTEPFIAPSTYEDQDLLNLVGTATQKLNIESSDLLRSFGRYCFSRLVGKYPVYVKDITSPIVFINIVDEVIHVEVKKLMPEAYLPKLSVKQTAENTLEIKYESKRMLCPLMEGLVLGCSDFFKHSAQIEHLTCMHDNADHCLVRVSFTALTS